MGIRETYLDEAGRLLYLFAGIEGEFGEGAATAESVPLAGGTIGELAGEGLDWTLLLVCCAAAVPASRNVRACRK